MAVLSMITCDLHDGESVKGRNLMFSVDGKEFSLDVCDDHLAEFRKAISPFMALATPAPRSAPRAAKSSSGVERRPDLAEIRAWANENGFTVAERGRVPASVIEAYDLRDPSAAPAKKSRRRS